MVNRRSKVSPLVPPTPSIIEMEAESSDPIVDPAHQAPRRHSTGSIGNCAALRSTIRRFQQRRRRPRKSSATVHCLEYFLSFLYCIGMSPIQTESVRKLPRWCNRLQTVLYWILALVSILDAADDVKHNWINFRVKENMLTFLTLGYFTANFLTRTYCIKLFVSSPLQMSNLLKKIDNVNTDESQDNINWTRSATVIIGVMSLAIGLISGVVGAGSLHDWSFEESILTRSFQVSVSLFVWTSRELENCTQILSEEYGENLTVSAAIFGGIGKLLSYCGTLHACVLLDLWPILVIQIYNLQSKFTETVRSTKPSNKEDSYQLSCHWNYYMRLREVCNLSDDVFGNLLKLIHMQNMLLFGYFLLEVLKKEPLTAPLLMDLISVVKVTISYYMAQKLAAQNDQYETCIIECSKRRPTIEMNGVHVSVAMLLKDMKKHPIGVGRADFFVDETFVLKFAGAVGSIFVLLSGESGESCQRRA